MPRPPYYRSDMSRPSIYDLDDLLELRGRLSAIQAEAILGIPQATVTAAWSRAIRRGEIAPWPRTARGGRERSSHTVCNPNLERNTEIIRLLTEERLTFKEIADKLGLPSRCVVAGVVRRHKAMLKSREKKAGRKF